MSRYVTRREREFIAVSAIVPAAVHPLVIFHTAPRAQTSNARRVEHEHTPDAIRARLAAGPIEPFRMKAVEPVHEA
jgi:hypothetical protein